MVAYDTFAVPFNASFVIFRMHVESILQNSTKTDYNCVEAE